MPSKVTNYQCPSCTAPLHFDSGLGKLKCDYCETTYTVNEIEVLYADKEKSAQEEFQETENLKIEETATKEEYSAEWDTSDLTENWGTDDENVCVYICSSCGAEMICENTTAATSCPYCDNPTVVSGQLSGVLKPDVIIPFKFDKTAAVNALKKHYKGKLLLPKAFSEENHLKEIKGIYVPFWLYDAHTEGDSVFCATKIHVHRDNTWETTITEHYKVHRSGTLDFVGVPADASKKMPDDYMDSIEPYNYSDLKPFSTAYLPGYFADRYDVTAEENASRIDLRCKNSTLDFLKNDVTGYTTVIRQSSSFRMDRGKVKYALLPVWALSTKWNNENYLFMMNGQTGKVVGDLPIDNKKLAAVFASITVAVTLLCSVFGIGEFIFNIINTFLGGIV